MVNKLPVNCSEKIACVAGAGWGGGEGLRGRGRGLGNRFGLVLDEQLSFDVYFDSLCEKISKRIGILDRIALCTITKNRYRHMRSHETPRRDSDKHCDAQQANV